MKFGLSGGEFGNLIALMAGVAVVIAFPLFYIAKKMGFDTNSRTFQLSAGVLGAIILIIIPFCLSDLPITYKIFGTILALAVGVGNFLATDRMGKRLREYLGLDKKDKIEKK